MSAFAVSVFPDPHNIAISDRRLLGQTQTVRPSSFRQVLVLVCVFAVAGSLAAQSSYSSKSSETFTLSGNVVNSVTGEPISHALVRISGGMLQRTTFADNEGHFQFEGVSGTSVALTAQKPGYFGDEELPAHSVQFVSIGPNSNSILLKLSPSSAISGRVLDVAGQPVERLPVQLASRNVRDGRKRLEIRGSQQTDEDGKFRFANLMPGTYYVMAGPGMDENPLLLIDGQRPKTGYPVVYYPGVPSLASASPLELTAGQQAQPEFSISAVPVYPVSGVVNGFVPAQGVGLQFFSQSGDQLALSANFNMETGIFRAESVPAGVYTLKAFSQAGSQMLRAETRLNVSEPMSNIHLALAPVSSIPVIVRAESRNSAAAQAISQGFSPANVRLTSTDPMGPELYSTTVRNSSGIYSPVLQNVDPGTYSAVILPLGDWYVASAQYGQTNLLSEDLTIPASGPSFQIEIVVRDDGATLTGTVKSSDGSPARATVLVLPERGGRANVKSVVSAGADGFTVNGLAPGDYLVFAFDYADGIEYTNPDALQAYIAQAAHVTVSAAQKSQVTLDLIRREGAQ